MQLRCVCLNLTFADLLRIARRRGITSADELGALTGCGTKCASCLPLIDDLLATGCVRIGDQLFPFPDPDRAADDHERPSSPPPSDAATDDQP